MTKNRINKIVSILLIVSMALNNSIVFADGIDVNVSGGEGEGYTGGGAGGNNAIVGDLELKGARVSLWDVETQEQVGETWDMVDFSKKSYEEVSKFRRLSGLTKPQIMSFNERIDDNMQGNIDDYNRYIDCKTFIGSYENNKKELEEKKALLDAATDETEKADINGAIFLLERTISTAEAEMDEHKYESDYKKMEDYLCSESIQFPELYMRTTSTGQMDTGEGAEYANKKENERIEGIKNFYKNEENTYKLIVQFANQESTAEKFDEGKICILLEPLLCFCNTVYLPDSYWMMTSAEIGLLAINGYDDVNKVGYEKGVSTNINKTIVYKGQLGGVAYKALPYGTFKENDGLIKAIKAYEYSGKAVTITNESGYRDMIKMMGCLEITAVKATESEIKIEFHPNGGQLSTEAGNYNKNKIDDSYTKIIKSNEKIKIDKTYSDNFFSDVYSEEHTYTRYNTKADMSGKYYSVDSESSFTEDTVLYVDWSKNPPPSTSAGTGFVLYEDELSYVYDYNSIGTPDTRRLTGKANVTSGPLHIYNMIKSWCGESVPCNNRGSANFSVDVSHIFTGADYSNCVLEEQQTSIGDTTYAAVIQEQQEKTFIEGSELNHIFVGYRDKVKDLRSAYDSPSNNGTKNDLEENIALQKYSITSSFTPAMEGLGSKEFNNNLQFIYTFSGNSTNSLAYGEIPACSNGGNEVHYDCCESWTDEDGNEHCSCPGHECYWHCEVDEIETSIEGNTSFPVSRIKQKYDNVTFKQYSYAGNDTSYGDSIFPIQDHNTNGTITYEDRQASGTRQINIPDFNGIDYNYDNIAENGQAIGTYNAKELDTIEFYPFIRMKYKDTLSDNYNDSYILAQKIKGK